LDKTKTFEIIMNGTGKLWSLAIQWTCTGKTQCYQSHSK